MTDETSATDGDGQSTSAYSEGLTETRRVIDVQIEMIENTDTEIVSLMRLNLFGLGGVVTLTAYLPDLIARALPWVILASFWFISSILIAAFIYRGVTIYAGFGDHGADSSVPRQKVPYDALITSAEDVTGVEGFSKPDAPSADAFRTAVLNEHQSGIAHNNVEIKYRSQIHQQVILLLLIAMLSLGIGLTVGIADLSGPSELTLPVLATVAAIAAGCYTIVKALGLIGRFIQTKADPNRLSYGYAFDRKYPYLSQLCLFVMTYLYDPVDGEDDW